MINGSLNAKLVVKHGVPLVTTDNSVDKPCLQSRHWELCCDLIHQCSGLIKEHLEQSLILINTWTGALVILLVSSRRADHHHASCCCAMQLESLSDTSICTAAGLWDDLDRLR